MQEETLKIGDRLVTYSVGYMDGDSQCYGKELCPVHPVDSVVHTSKVHINEENPKENLEIY